MTDLRVSEALLEALWHRNNFEVPADELTFFALRGTLPVALSGTTFQPEHQLRLLDVDYLHMRCTIGQWKPGTGIAVFPGSTVPYVNYIRASLAKGGAGTNMLMLGCYSYAKGVHKLGTPTQHKAFRQNEFFPVWRTNDDLDFDLADRLDMSPGFVWDDLHCAWCADPGQPRFASAGCQVVAGFPQSPRTGNEPDTGPWATFRKAAYDLPQKVFRYGLFAGAEALALSTLKPDMLRQSLRFGSRGDLVARLQETLVAHGYPLPDPDGTFGRDTLEAVMAFQQRRFGTGNADGIVGPQTASALKFDLPFLAADAVPPPAAAPPRVPAAPSGPAVAAEHNPALAVAPVPVEPDAADLAAPAVVRPGPVPVPAVSARTIKATGVGGVWTATADGGQPVYLGTETDYQGRRGLYQEPKRLKDLQGGTYEPAEWVNTIGPWAYFIQPTSRAESAGYFGRLNTYDGAAFTWGFFQFAAHTAQDNLILLFRRLLAQPEAASYFPDLALKDGRVVKTDGTLLDVATGHPMTTFMTYLNPDGNKVAALNAARLLFWTAASHAVKAAQVQLAVAVCRRRLAYGVRRYGLDITGGPLRRAIWVADALHQGRATYAQLRDALGSTDPDGALAKVGLSSQYAERIQTVGTAIADNEGAGHYEGLSWGNGPFVPDPGF